MSTPNNNATPQASIAKFRLLLALVGVVIVAAACSTTEETGSSRPGNASSEFVDGTLIPEDHFEITNERCVESIGSANRDGEIVDAARWTVMGTFTNTLDVPSPSYELQVWYTLDDGTTQEALSHSIFPLEPGASEDFSSVVIGEVNIELLSERGDLSSPDLVVLDCGVIVEDSPLNYVNE